LSNAFTADRERNITPKRKVIPYFRFRDVRNTKTSQENMVKKKEKVKQ